MALNDYVKFLRGTPLAYKNLTEKDKDTLYFISEDGSASGLLYLGTKLIGSGGSLNALEDVNLANAVAGDVLTYDAESGKWIAKSLEALNKINSNVFTLEEDGTLNLLGFNEAEVGAQLLKSVDGKLSWVKPETTTVEGLQTAVGTLQTDVATLNGKVGDLETLVGAPANELESVPASGIFAELNKKANAEDVYSKTDTETAIATAIANAEHLSYIIKGTAEEIDLEAENADKFIYLVGTEAPYDEYMVINGALEKVGDWSVDLSDYATIEALNSKVDKKEGFDLVAAEEITKLAGIEAGAQVNFITSVEEANFAVADGKLSLVAVEQAKVTGLTEALAGYTESIGNLNTSVGNLEKIIGDSAKLPENSNVIDEIVALQEIMKWHDIENN